MGSCCLRTATLIVGYLKATCLTLFFIFGVLLLTGVRIKLDDSYQDIEKDAKSILGFVGIFIIVFVAIHFVFVCFLLNGAHTGNGNHLQKYIIFTYLNLSLCVIWLIMNINEYYALIPALAFELLCVVIVHCHMKELDSETEVAADYNIMVKV